jgi:hypothetical protein
MAELSRQAVRFAHSPSHLQELTNDRPLKHVLEFTEKEAIVVSTATKRSLTHSRVGVQRFRERPDLSPPSLWRVGL